MLSAGLLGLAIATTGGPAAVRCIDPATPLQELALQYDRWPAPKSGSAEKAFELLKKAMQTRRPADYGTALLKYDNLSGNQEHSTDPHVQLAMSLLHLTGDEFNYDGGDSYRHRRPQYNTNAERFAGSLLPTLARNDPTQWLAAVALARLAMQTRGEQRYADAREALQRVLAADSTNSTARLAFRDLLLAQDSAQAALAYLTKYGVDCVPVLHAQAEAMMITGDTAAGARLYIRALEQAGPEDIDRFYQDMLVMADREELKKYNRLDPSARAAWIRRYWERNAASFDRTLVTRVTEQIVRAAFADQHFMRARVQSIVRGRAAFVDDSAKSMPWDLRGIMYVRHGAPLHRLRYAGECAGYEAWIYVQDGEPWILAFGKSCGPSDWFLEQEPACAGQAGTDFLGEPPAESATMRKALATPDSLTLREIYQVIARYENRYRDLLKFCSIVAAGGRHIPLELMQQEMAADRRNLVERVQWGSTAHRQFLIPLRMLTAAYEFRGGDGKPEVAVLTWIPAEDLAPALDRARASSVRLSYTLLDSIKPAQRAEHALAIPQVGSGTVRTAYTIPGIASGSLRLHITVMDPADSARGGTRTRQVAVRTAGPGPAISDIVVADAGTTGPLVRGGNQISPLPDHAVTVGQPFRLFYEAYGLSDDVAYDETIQVLRTSREGVIEQLGLFPGRKDERTIGLNEKARLDVRGVLVRDVEIAADFIPGDYTITVTLTQGGAAALKRSTTLRVDVPAPRSQAP